MKMKNQISSINFHLLEACNMRCKFCFAKYGHPKQMVSLSDAKKIIAQLANSGIEKISFAGGEPMLYPQLDELIIHAKQCGLTTMLITNGLNLTPDFLDRLHYSLDWVGLSFDSLLAENNRIMGRVNHMNEPISTEDYFFRMLHIKQRRIGLKVNTVVNAINVYENMSELIKLVQPERWKIMKVIFNNGVNINAREKFGITEEQFANFVIQNRIDNSHVQVVVEPESLMRGSYLMIDPQGRLYDNVSYRHTFSPKILEVGFEKAVNQICFDAEKFLKRNGEYDWEKKSNVSLSSIINPFETF